MDLPLLERPASTQPRSALQRFVESERFSNVVMIAVGLNALVLGVATYTELPEPVLRWCVMLDALFLTVFVVELILKLAAWRLRFFTNAWNLFDLGVVALSLVAAGPFTVLRTLRILRTLRLVSAVPQMRRVVEALIRAIPGISAILGVMMVFFYVSAVLATGLLKDQYPELFGALGASAITLFQLTLFDGWNDVVRQVGETHPAAPFFFIVFTVISAFAVLNLFIAVMVDSLRIEHDRLQHSGLEEIEEGQHEARRGLEELDAAMKTVENKLDLILEKIEGARAPDPAAAEPQDRA